MQDLRWKALRLAVVAGLLYLILRPVAGAENALATLLGATALYLAGHIYWISRLQRWLKNPDATTVPAGSGVWAWIFTALLQEARRQAGSQTRLGLNLERFQRAASALPDGLVLLNKSDQIEWCNPPAETLLGLNLEQDTGRRIIYLVRHAKLIEYLQSHDHPEPLRLKSLLTQDTTLEIQLVPFGDNQKLLLCRDISPMERLDTMRRDFIANVSHELRTPLTVVGGFLETLADMKGGIPKGTRHYFSLMQEQTSRMRHLVEDLLTLSQLENSQTPAQESTVDVPALLDSVLAEAQSLSNGRHRLTLQSEPGLHLSGSREELHSAFGNLVSNAIRYTPDDGLIALGWRMQGTEAVFSVKDNGIGIEPQHLSRLTERFYRVDRSRSRATGGTGLGLSIVKHILTRHQGRLQIESTPGVGSTFSAIFPVSRTVKEERAQSRPG